MSKRAKERALEAYPNESFVSEDYANMCRYFFIRGYEQAEKDLGWISVKDRLPEVGHFVLTCASDTETPQWIGRALLLEDGTWWDGEWVIRVDYWMEVPKLNKENVMTAPEKIYTNNRGAYTKLPIFSQADANVEYIRKDALLKWLQEVRAIPHENAIVRDLVFQEIINKLNSM